MDLGWLTMGPAPVGLLPYAPVPGEKSIEQVADRCDARLHADQAPARLEDTRYFGEEKVRALKVVQHIEHDDVIECRVAKRQPMRVGNGIEPHRMLDIDRNDIGEIRF